MFLKTVEGSKHKVGLCRAKPPSRFTPRAAGVPAVLKFLWHQDIFSIDNPTIFHLNHFEWYFLKETQLFHATRPSSVCSFSALE